MKKNVFLGILMLIASLMSDYLLAYNFRSVVISKLDPETISIVEFLYIFMCFLSIWFTLISIAYILGEDLKILLKYLGIMISIGLVLGSFMGSILATIDHQYYLGNMMIMIIAVWIICLFIGTMLYKAFTDED